MAVISNTGDEEAELKMNSGFPAFKISRNLRAKRVEQTGIRKK